MTERDKWLTFVELLERTGQSIAEIAKQLGVRRATVSDWVNKKIEPHLTPSQYEKALEIFQCTPRELTMAFEKHKESNTDLKPENRNKAA